ncbi:hypothetical protein [Streptomyces sp. NPDC057336]|uniref:hypothetical protein n=1 Tax=Streptomyces sp. NPDC057336 TaxID=3346102 RepID=UPI00362AC3A8
MVSLIRVRCSLRDAGPGRRPEPAELAGASEEMFAGLGLDPAGPPAQLRHDRVDALLIAGVVPGEHATAAVELNGGERDFFRWIDTFHAENADAAARAAQAQIEGGGPSTRRMLPIGVSICTVMHVGPPSRQCRRNGFNPLHLGGFSWQASKTP